MKAIKEAEKKTDQWFELTSRKDEFQNILRLLVDFDEKTGRYKNYGGEEQHWLRKSASRVTDLNELRVFIKNIGSSIYMVVVEASVNNGVAVTAWIHEDGIHSEREQFQDNPDHPVHGIVCLTDLFKQATEELNQESIEKLAVPVLDLMQGVKD